MTVNLYLGYVDLETENDHIKSDFEERGVKVVELEELSRQHNKFKSYRLCIRKKDYNELIKGEFLPEGVVIKKFFHRQKNDGNAISSEIENGSN